MLSEPTANPKIQQHAVLLPLKFLRAFRTERRRIKRTVHALLALLALANAVEARAQDPEWFVVDMNDAHVALMNVNILPGTRFWAATVARPEYEHEMHKEGTTIALHLVEMDCRNHRLKFVQMIGRSDDDEETYDEQGVKWQNIIPGTVADGYRRYACGVDEKPDPWVNSPKEMRETLLDLANE